MDLNEIEKRLQVLEDKEAIKELHRDYIFWLNNRQWEEMTECFTHNAVAHIYRHPLRTGKEQIHKLFTEVMSGVNVGKGRDGHFATLPVIEVNAHKAKGHWLLYILIADPVTGNAMRWTQGRYECEYEKVEGKWKFSKLVFINPWPRQPETLPKVEDLKALGINL
jgi:ketosteroid isomerase-like protein